MVKYNVHIEWKDPTETPDERRRMSRIKAPLTLTIAARRRGRNYIGPGIVKDISQTGALVVTKHRLKPGQLVEVSVPTDTTKLDEFMPSEFRGVARVARIEPKDDRTSRVALEFGEAFTQNLEFAVFVNSLAIRPVVVA